MSKTAGESHPKAIEKNNSKTEIMPVIKPLLDTLGPVFVLFGIQNVSHTTAINVEIEFSLLPEIDYKRKAIFPIINPGQKYRFFLPEGNMKSLSEKLSSIQIDCKYQNIFGASFCSSEKLAVKEILCTWIDAKILVDEPLERRMKTMTDKIDELEKTVSRSISRNGRGVLFVTPEDEKREREEAMKEFEEYKNRTKQEKQA